jgi:glutamate synthase domain-containing protein 2
VVLFASGKLISAGRQLRAMSLGADVTYSARGFLFALGCIQAQQCNQNNCPTGITTHDKHLQQGLDIEEKARRVANYVEALCHDHAELLAATGHYSTRELTHEDIYQAGFEPMKIQKREKIQERETV